MQDAAVRVGQPHPLHATIRAPHGPGDCSRPRRSRRRAAEPRVPRQRIQRTRCANSPDLEDQTWGRCRGLAGQEEASPARLAMADPRTAGGRGGRSAARCRRDERRPAKRQGTLGDDFRTSLRRYRSSVAGARSTSRARGVWTIRPRREAGRRQVRSGASARSRVGSAAGARQAVGHGRRPAAQDDGEFFRLVVVRLDGVEAVVGGRHIPPGAVGVVLDAYDRPD